VRLFIALLFLPVYSMGQDNSDSTEIYNVNRWLSAGIGGVGILVSQEMISRLGRAEDTPVEVILRLDKNDVNSFDRVALEQDNLSYALEAQKISDYFLTGAVLIPATLFIDKKIRKHWIDVSLMYVETQALTANLYVWAGPKLNERFRPITY